MIYSAKQGSSGSSTSITRRVHAAAEAGVIGGMGAYIVMRVANKILDWLDTIWRKISGAPAIDVDSSRNPSATKPTGTLVDGEVRENAGMAR